MNSLYKIFKRLDFYIIILAILITMQMVWWLIFFFDFQKRYIEIIESRDKILLNFLNNKNMDNIPDFIYFNKNTKEYKVKEEIIEKRLEEWNKNKRMLIAEALFFLFMFFLTSLLILIFYQKQQKLLYEKTMFLNSFTHELKTPITAVKLNLQTMQKKIKDKKMILLLDAGLYEIDVLNQKISKILYEQEIKIYNFNKIYSVDFTVILNNVLKELNFEISKKNSNIEIQNYLDTNIYNIKLPPQWISFILKELIINSLKYSEPMVHIKILLQEESFIFKKFLKISIIDNGWGIPDGVHYKDLLESYTRYHLDKGFINGTGLGLYYIKQILKKSNNKLIIKKLNKGLQVDILLRQYGKKQKI